MGVIVLSGCVWVPCVGVVVGIVGLLELLDLGVGRVAQFFWSVSGSCYFICGCVVVVCTNCCTWGDSCSIGVENHVRMHVAVVVVEELLSVGLSCVGMCVWGGGGCVSQLHSCLELLHLGVGRCLCLLVVSAVFVTLVRCHNWRMSYFVVCLHVTSKVGWCGL